MLQTIRESSGFDMLRWHCMSTRKGENMLNTWKIHCTKCDITYDENMVTSNPPRRCAACGRESILARAKRPFRLRIYIHHRLMVNVIAETSGECQKMWEAWCANRYRRGLPLGSSMIELAEKSS